MNESLVSAVFNNQAEAEHAISELRSQGVQDGAISIIAQHDGDKAVQTDGGGEEVAKDVVGTAAVGAGVGTLLGIAALAIPGVGPLVAAGAIAGSAIPGAALTGAAIGGAAGGLTGLLKDHGVDHDDAAYYEGRINDGGVFISVDTREASISKEAAEGILYDNGGLNNSRATEISAA